MMLQVSIKEDWRYGSNFTSHRQHHEDGNQQMILQTALHFHLPNATDPLKRFTDTLYITQVRCKPSMCVILLRWYLDCK